MIRLVSTVSLLLVLVLAACVNTLDFDGILNGAVGRRYQDLTYPSPMYLDKTQPSDPSIRRYAVAKCRFDLLLAADRSTVSSWQYLDASSESFCHQMVKSRP